MKRKERERNEAVKNLLKVKVILSFIFVYTFVISVSHSNIQI